MGRARRPGTIKIQLYDLDASPGSGYELAAMVCVVASMPVLVLLEREHARYHALVSALASLIVLRN